MKALRLGPRLIDRTRWRKLANRASLSKETIAQVERNPQDVRDEGTKQTKAAL